MATKKDLLAEVPLFKGCSPRKLTHIARLATRVSSDPGDVLTEEGHVGTEFFVIERGEAEVTAGGRSVKTLSAGDYFGEIALLDNRPRSATVTATTPMVLYAIQDKDFAAFLDDSPKVTLRILKAATERLREVEHAPTYKLARF